jgi:cell division protein FtsB
MTARRGSLRFKIKRLAAAPLHHSVHSPAIVRAVAAWTNIGVRVAAGALALAAVVAFGAQTARLTAANVRLHHQIQAAQARNAALVRDSAALRRQIGLLHDPDYLVPLIHEQLGLVKPHEIFIEVQPAPALRPK